MTAGDVRQRAAIAAGDALCGHALGQRASGQDHREATTLLTRVRPDGDLLARRLSRLLSDKSLYQYGTFCDRVAAERAAKDAGQLIEALDSRGL